MKKSLTLLLAFFLKIVIPAAAQCGVSYTYSGTTDTLQFSGSSGLSNVHYYWNFGDGSGSSAIAPQHIFPDNGYYLVTLYAHDTLAGISCYYQNWIDVVKPDTSTLQLLLSDTVHPDGYGDFMLTTTNLSTHTNGLAIDCDAGPALNSAWNVWLDTAWGASLFFDRLQAFSYDSINTYRVYKEYYRTVPYQYDEALNYGSCSPNFEVNIDYRPNGALVTLTSMNKSGQDTFWITGMGNGIPLSGYKVSYLYPYISYERNFPWLVEYEKSDTAHGCFVRGTQEILIRNPYYEYPVSCAIYAQPADMSVNSGDAAHFSIATGPGLSYQWQQDDGTGYRNLSDAGPYSGTHTNVLTISTATTAMNNYHYRCVVLNENGCHNTGLPAVLGVHDIGIYPNPVHDLLHVNGYTSGSFTIIDALGQTVMEKLFTDVIDVKQLPAGVYNLLLYNKDGQYISEEKFIKN